jgi:hypothetical protein
MGWIGWAALFGFLAAISGIATACRFQRPKAEIKKFRQAYEGAVEWYQSGQSKMTPTRKGVINVRRKANDRPVKQNNLAAFSGNFCQKFAPG